jgi:hypothetical protein
MRELESLWWDWLSTGERLLRSLYEQSMALTLRDMERVQCIQSELDTMLSRMQKVDTQAAQVAEKLALELGGKPSFRGLLSVLDQKEAHKIEAIATRVKIVAKNLSDQLEENQLLLENELRYVSGTLALIAKVSHDQQGTYQKNPNSLPGSVLLDQHA